MPIDRSAYNLLQDDSGAAVPDGTVWTKNQVKTVILDPIDAMVELTGTWTPALKFGGAAVGMTFSVQTGTYTRSGNLVAVEFRVALTAKGSSTGSVTITGLPYSALGTPVGSVIDFAVAGVGMTGTPFSIVSGTSVLLMQTSATVRAPLADTNFAATTDIRGSVLYRV